MLQCVAVSCSVLQCVAETGLGLSATKKSRGGEVKLLQCVAACCSIALCCTALQCVAVCCIVLHCIAVCCSVLQCVAVSSSWFHRLVPNTFPSPVLQCVAVRCSVLQCVAVCCSVLQCVGTILPEHMPRKIFLNLLRTNDCRAHLTPNSSVFMPM